ncbi:MAG: hypothetical protein KDK08_26945 [Rhizobiaceae bacterium]|nr:hypothetical protein [Rhizobiaceae bacterium]
MTRTVIISALALNLAATIPAAAEEMPRTLLGVDVSGTSTFLVDRTSANAAGSYVEKYISGLDHPHELTMISVGDAGLARRLIEIRAMITARRASSARRVAPQFGGYFRSLPDHVKRGTISPQNTTSLIDFFHSLEPFCKAGNATAILFSDGLEWSATVDGRAFAAGKIGLPKPSTAFLEGCEVRLLGVGQVKSEMESGGLATRLVPQWRDYLRAAGADPVVVVGSGFSY